MTESNRPSFEKNEPLSFDKPPQLPSGPPNYGPLPGYVQPGYGPGYGPPPAYGPPGGYPPSPYGFGALPPQLKPSSNIGWAVGAIFAFWPLAIPAFIFATKVDDLWFRGDRVGAEKASHDARLYGMIGVIIGVVLAVVFFVIFLFAILLVSDAASHINDNIPTYAPTGFGPS